MAEPKPAASAVAAASDGVAGLSVSKGVSEASSAVGAEAKPSSTTETATIKVAAKPDATATAKPVASAQPGHISLSGETGDAAAVDAKKKSLVESEELEKAKKEKREKTKGVIFKNRSAVPVALKGKDNKEVFCLRYSPDSRFLAAGCGDGSIRVFNSLGHASYVLSVLQSSDLPTTCIRFRPPMGNAKTKNVCIAANADGSISHWHMTSQTCLYRIEEEDNQIYALDYRRDGEHFVSAGRDTKIRIYDESTKSLVHTLHGGNKKAGTSGHSNRIYTVKYRPQDPNVLVSGGWDNTVQVWDTRVGQSVKAIYGPHLCGDALDMDPSGETIVTASWRPEKALQVWDFGTGNAIQTIKWASRKKSSRMSKSMSAVMDEKEEEPAAAAPPATTPASESALGSVTAAMRSRLANILNPQEVVKPRGNKICEMLYAVSFSPTGNTLCAGGSGTCEAKMFDVKNGYKCMDTMQMPGDKGVYSLTYAPNGRRLAVAGGDQDVQVITLPG